MCSEKVSVLSVNLKPGRRKNNGAISIIHFFLEINYESFLHGTRHSPFFQYFNHKLYKRSERKKMSIYTCNFIYDIVWNEIEKKNSRTLLTGRTNKIHRGISFKYERNDKLSPTINHCYDSEQNSVMHGFSWRYTENDYIVSLEFYRRRVGTAVKIIIYFYRVDVLEILKFLGENIIG